MKKLLGLGVAGLFLVTTAGLAFSVDDATIDLIQVDAKNANNKADNNDGKITGLYDNVTNLQNQIDDIITNGTQGPKGDPGENGQDGADGLPGTNGTDGLSAYEVAVQNGFVGSETEWIASLKGDKGDPGIAGLPGANGNNGLDGKDGTNGTDGQPGLKGDKGDTGERGPQGEPGVAGGTGPKGDTGDIGPQGPIGIGAIQAFSADGEFVGILDEIGFESQIFIPSINKFIRIPVQGTSAGFLTNTGLGGLGLYFETDDCSGQPYVLCQTGGASLVGLCQYYVIPDYNHASPPNSTLTRYFVTEGETLSSRLYYSRFHYGGCVQDSGEMNSLPVVEIGLPFNTPIALPLSLE